MSRGQQDRTARSTLTSWTAKDSTIYIILRKAVINMLNNNEAMTQPRRKDNITGVEYRSEFN